MRGKRFLTALLFLALATLAPFFFPWPFALFAGLIAAFVVPPAALLNGVLLDVLYYDHHGLPYFTLIGVLISAVAFFVQGFVKTRIMS